MYEKKYTVSGLIKAEKNPAGEIVCYGYDNKGNKTWAVDPRGTVSVDWNTIPESNSSTPIGLSGYATYYDYDN